MTRRNRLPLTPRTLGARSPTHCEGMLIMATRGYLLVVALGLVSGFLGALAARFIPAGSVVARQVVIVDGQGATRATMGVESDGDAALTLYDPGDVRRMGFMVRPGGAANITVRDDEGEVRARMSVVPSEDIVQGQTVAQGYSSGLSLSRPEGGSIALDVRPCGEAFLGVWGAVPHKPPGVMAATASDGTPRFQLQGPDLEVLFRAP